VKEGSRRNRRLPLICRSAGDRLTLSAARRGRGAATRSDRRRRAAWRCAGAHRRGGGGTGRRRVRTRPRRRGVTGHQAVHRIRIERRGSPQPVLLLEPGECPLHFGARQSVDRPAIEALRRELLLRLSDLVLREVARPEVVGVIAAYWPAGQPSALLPRSSVAPRSGSPARCSIDLACSAPLSRRPALVPRPAGSWWSAPERCRPDPPPKRWRARLSMSASSGGILR
jgi:hypothetical protein